MWPSPRGGETSGRLGSVPASEVVGTGVASPGPEDPSWQQLLVPRRAVVDSAKGDGLAPASGM